MSHESSEHKQNQLITKSNLLTPFHTPLATNGIFSQETITREVDIRTSSAGAEQPLPQATSHRTSTAAMSYGELPQNTSQVSENLHSILKNADSWRQFSSSEDK